MVKVRQNPRMKKFFLFPTFLAVLAFPGCATPPAPVIKPVAQQVPPAAAGVHGYKTSEAAVEVLPVQISSSIPEYPSELHNAGISGKAAILFTVKADGSVVDAVVVEADDVRFGEAARAAVLHWRFHPALIGGHPVDCRLLVPVAFAL